MVLLEIASYDELVNLDYVVTVNRKKNIIYLNREGEGLIPIQLTRDEMFEFITNRNVQRYKLG